MGEKEDLSEFYGNYETVRGVELLIPYLQQMPQQLNHRASYIHIYTEQENSDSLLMPLLPARLLKIQHVTSFFPCINHFLQQSHLFMSSPNISEAFPASTVHLCRLRWKLGWSKDDLCANPAMLSCYGTLLPSAHWKADHIWALEEQAKEKGWGNSSGKGLN